VTHARVIASPIGALRLVEERGAIVAIEFVDADGKSRPALGGADTPLLRETEAQLAAYFAGALRVFTFSFGAPGTEFQKRVWTRLGAIPYGVTTTYQRIADELKSTARPVGGANGANPIAIVVPCHRVVGSTGLTGYGGGLWRKEWLLAHEGVDVASLSRPYGAKGTSKQGALFS
jgi:methylated-DNA-[protein]-cysteine S-methyltransferase